MPTIVAISGPQLIEAVSAIPTEDPTHSSLDGKAFRVDSGSAIRLYGQLAAGSGKLYLLEWSHKETLTIGEWYPVDIDSTDGKAVGIHNANPSGLDGKFSAWWLCGDKRAGQGSGYYLALAVISGGGVVGDLTLFAQARVL